MGKGYKIKCEKCGYEKEYHLGIGMMFPSFEANVLKSIKKGEYGEKAKQNLHILDEYTEEEWLNYWFKNVEKKMFYCSKCKSVVVETYFKLGDFEPHYNCENCKIRLLPTEPNKIREYRCSKCGNIGEFDKRTEFLWD